MPLEPVQVMELDRATSRLEIVHENPTRQWMHGTGNGWALITWQNGVFYDTGGNQMPIDTVPPEYVQAIRDNPVRPQLHQGPTVTATCRLCGSTMNASDMEEHLIRHVDDTMKQAGAVAVPPPAPPVIEKAPPLVIEKVVRRVPPPAE